MTQLLQKNYINPSIETVVYTREENLCWQELYSKQLELLEGRVHESFWEFLEELNLPKDRIPQLYEPSNILRKKTGWSITEVDGLISSDDFFILLANKIFPSTTYIRTNSGFSRDPDIFHELFAHCPILLDKDYAIFLSEIARFALECSKLEQMIIQRFLWYTIEVGLIQTSHGLRIYGGALISSPQEVIYSLESKEPERKAFNLLEIARSPYRADVLQSTYYIINDFQELYNFEFSLKKLSNVVADAKRLGEYQAKFNIENNKYTNVNIF